MASAPPNANLIAKIHETFEQFEALLKQTLRPPPPLLGDGKYNEEAVPEPVPTGLAEDLIALGFDVPKDLGTLIDVIKSQLTGVVDDKKYLVRAFEPSPILTYESERGEGSACAWTRKANGPPIADGESHPDSCQVAAELQERPQVDGQPDQPDLDISATPTPLLCGTSIPVPYG
jgi:hypothetical protein